MNPDYIELGGILFGSWVAGWACGYAIYMFRRFVDFI